MNIDKLLNFFEKLMQMAEKYGMVYKLLDKVLTRMTTPEALEAISRGLAAGASEGLVKKVEDKYD